MTAELRDLLMRAHKGAGRGRVVVAHTGNVAILQEGAGGVIKKTVKCKPEVMHSTGRHECIFILCAKPG